jgi:hypothetical protein
VSRRGGLPWAPTSLPPLRRQWCHVLAAGLDRLRDQPGTAALAGQAEEDLAGIEKSVLFWVARDMTELATDAAASLPEWSPAAAIPEEFGLIAWAKPVGTFDWPVPGSAQRVRMPVDAMTWGIRGGAVGVSCAVRTERIAGQLNRGLGRLPLVPHPVGVWDLEEPVDHRLEDGAVSPLSVLGAAWLLSQQPSVSERREIRTATEQPAADGGPGDDADAVSIIELRRLRQPDGAAGEGGSRDRRRYDTRFWVSGHWRQQACGPGRKLRKPLWISPFIKGPEDAPLADTTRVYVWRR